MSHLFINHHFFYNSNKALRGPSPKVFMRQVGILKKYLKPARKLFDGFTSDETYFSITIDDGSKSVLDIIDFLINEKIHTCICVCGNAILKKEVLSIHKINLLRNEIGDIGLYKNLVTFFKDSNFDKIPLRGAVKYKDLYRYDDLDTRKLKIALNYQLKENDKIRFVNLQFNEYLGPEIEWAEKLYLSVNDIESIMDYIELVYHGTQHKLWKDLEGESLYNEINPPDKINHLFRKEFLLSIPYGMDGSFDEGALINSSNNIEGAFTMGRSIKHKYDKKNNFWWIHRYDQADIFKQDAKLKLRLSSL